MSTPLIPLVCHGCGAVASVNRVTAGLRCACGSSDLDLFEGAAHGPGTGWNTTRPDPLKGWNEYAGPMPGANPRSAPAGPDTCPECKGSKVDFLDGGICRACGGTGHRTPTTSVAPAPYVKKHNYPSTQTTTPFMGRRRTATEAPAGPVQERKPNVSRFTRVRDDHASAEKYSDNALRERRTMGYPMHEADCPSCGHAPTHLVNDYKDDAWWHCKNCGPLVNIDKNPHVDPYNPPADFQAKPRMFSATEPKTGAVRGKGRVLAMLHDVRRSNPGLTTRESLGIVRATVAKFSE